MSALLPIRMVLYQILLLSSIWIVSPSDVRHLVDLTIQSADDCIAIKSGWEDVGMNYNVPSAYIYITHLECQAPFRR